ncbi:PD-(D/E)XK nuclease-like domain-containing protein [Aquimarina sp. 2-A2]|uniref:PD-(D/E)XK nuclease-like domain-containing protein n=1 Tax=Aquimarina sp. 2-A2 TaxID=3382644 RepID=UPI00387F19DD
MKYDPQNIEDGVYTDMPNEVYHENRTHYSSSSIKEAYKSNAHFKAYLERENERKSHFDFGHAFELSITDHKEFDSSVAIYSDTEIIEQIREERPEIKSITSTKEYQKWKQSFYLKNAEKLIIQESGNDSLDVLTVLKKSLYSHSAAPKILTNCEYQTSIFWTCPETGMKLKTRPDFWKPETKDRGAVISDLKTDKDSDPSSHLKTIVNLNYPLQSVIQIKGLQHAKLIGESFRFFWIVCSKSSPFNTEVYEFDSTDIKAFTESVDFKLSELKRAIDKGVFLSYQPDIDYGVKTVSFPYWYKNKMGVVDSIDDINNY